ncbi:MAG: 1-acyl-sn-glycerol-3-phosphate acyltransferase [Cellvibrionales bacterium]|nr:1-acyl-sn-glycerol-3-phosphate acyltransferase [Cellvibrionales bacterium]
MSSGTDKFSAIRPFNDEEASEVIHRIIHDSEFLSVITQLGFPKLPKFLEGFLKPVIRFQLARKMRGVNTVSGLQEKIESYVSSMINDTMTSFQVKGIEKLDPNEGYLFIANHRDIVIDPALVNYSRHINGYDTVRIAIGDNLLSKTFISDLMRVNKSFVVNRSAKGPRELLASLKLLSEYISTSLRQDKASIWIAQREGRAKDGLDKTDPAILKMLVLNDRKNPFNEAINALKIVPVSVSYEYDPCDILKARELSEKDKTGQYRKREHEDVESIAKGVTGFKGRVQLNYGNVITEDFADADALAEYLDKEILSLYQIPPSHYFAYEELFGHIPYGDQLKAQYDLSSEALERERQVFKQHFSSIDEEYRPFILWGYANPLLEKMQLDLMETA